MDTRAKELVRIGAKLKSEFQDWHLLCQDIAENFFPGRADFTQSIDWSDFAGDQYESWPNMARETLGNSIAAMLRQGEWFKVHTGNDDLDERDDIARALDFATKSLQSLIYDRRANFATATIEADHDWVAFGNPVLSVEESRTRDHLLFKAHHPRSCTWIVNGEGKIDHLHRDTPMQARSIVNMRGWDIHADIQKCAEKEPSKTFKVQHVVCPMEYLYGDDTKKRREMRDMPFLSLYIDMEHEEVLGEGALPVFNYIVPRWRSFSSRPQGFSPAAINSLPDGRMIQSMAQLILEQGEKAIDPPLAARGEIFRDEGTQLYAGGMTYVDLAEDKDIRDAIMTLDTSQNIGIGLDMKQDVRQLIAESFLLNKLFLPNARDMREIEVQVRTEEWRRAALPFFQPIENEYHLPMLDVAFQMAINARAIDFEDFPIELQGEEVTFRFDTPLNTAEGRMQLAAFNETLQVTAASAQFDNTIPAMLNFKKMTKDAVRGTGAEPDWFKSDREQADEETRIRQAQALATSAEALREGADVGGQIADASKKMQEAGLV